jgi:hypothetical protein
MSEKKVKIRVFFKLFFTNLIALLSVLVVVELCGQFYFFFYPSYINNCMIPHKLLGWKTAPNCSFVSTGGRMNAEFFQEITTNSHGFRDKERTLTKPPETIRIAFMGDSMIEAFQVPFEKTAGQVLENKLNRILTPENDRNFEVLNFGVGNYGLGQMFLIYKEIASKFQPDYVLVFLNDYLLERTIEFQRFETSIKNKEFFSNRPVFWFKDPKFIKEIKKNFLDKQKYFSKLEEGFLLINPPSFLSGFEKVSNVMLEKRKNALQNPEISREKRRSVFFQKKLWDKFKNVFLSLESKPGFQIKLSKLPIVEEVKIPINLKILSFFQKESKSKLIILDSSRYYYKNENISLFLKYFSKLKGTGYIDLSEKFLEFEKGGSRIRWREDPHFNAKGQRLFGEIIFDGIAGYFR